MELLTLNADYQASQLVERYASLIWTERYFSSGDFELVTTDVERMIKLLPLESLVTLRESTVPMIVESHRIEKKTNESPQLTIRGRSFETVLERRAAVKTSIPGGPRVAWTELRDKESDAAYQVIRQIIGDVDQVPIMSLNDALPMVELIVPADYSPTLTTNKYEIKPGNLYSVVLELLTANHHGIKAVRPDALSNKIGLEIYNGADLTRGPLTQRVVFDAKFDQFDDATYLLSEAGSTNWAYVFSSSTSLAVSKTSALEPNGLNRRVLYLDVSSEGAYTTDTLKTRALIELYKYNVTALFDGQIAEQVASMYNVLDGGYTLGDIIRLDGEYGLSEFVRVAEFIRTDDNTGSKAYPTFQVITEQSDAS